MGNTLLFNLPYPNPADPANVPSDIKQLAEATSVVINGVPIKYPPPPPNKATAGPVNLPFSTSNKVLTGLGTIAIKNPHSTAKLLVQALFTGVITNSTANNGLYVCVQPVAGQTPNPPVPFKPTFYTGMPNFKGTFSLYCLAWANPLQTITFNAQGRKSVNIAGGAVSSVFLGVTPIVYTLDSLPVYVEPAEIDVP